MALGPTVLVQAAETLRKIRNSARFILGNLRNGAQEEGWERVKREDMGLVCCSPFLSFIQIVETSTGGAVCDARVISCGEDGGGGVRDVQFPKRCCVFIWVVDCCS